MSIRAVIFDIGGVLEITPRTGWEAVWEGVLGLQPGELNARVRHVWVGGSYEGWTEEQVERGIAETLGLDDAQLAAFMKDMWDDYLGTPNTELIEYFRGLRGKYITGIISNSFAGARRMEQERYGFCDLCDSIVYSHEELVKKPDPAIFERGFERFGVQPHEMIFLDDVDVIVDAARAMGIHAIQFRSNEQAIGDIEACLAANS